MGSSSDSRAPVDWETVFDLIASEYGYTWEQFTGMTYILLKASLESIGRRKHNDLSIQAALRGIKIDPWQKPKTLSPKVLKNARDSALKLLKEKQVAHGKR